MLEIDLIKHTFRYPIRENVIKTLPAWHVVAAAIIVSSSASPSISLLNINIDSYHSKKRKKERNNKKCEYYLTSFTQLNPLTSILIPVITKLNWITYLSNSKIFNIYLIIWIVLNTAKFHEKFHINFMS